MSSPAPGNLRGCTPARDKEASRSTGQLGCTEAQRQAVLLDIHKSAQEVDISSFLNTFLPPVDDALVAAVLKKLKTGPVHYISSTGRLRGFPKNPSARAGLHEAAVFRPLDAVINAIIKAGASISQQKPRMEYSSNPNMTPVFEVREASSRPDGGLMSLQSLLAWINFTCVAEYKVKKSDKTIKDNRMKIIWSLCQIMKDDARKRFSFGITVEDTDMRFYYISRQRLIVSTAFNFVIEHEHLLKFFLSLAFVEDYKLGWDTSMRRLKGGNFDIEVRTGTETLVYRTVDILSNYSAESPLGRGTRVWSARLLVDGKPSEELVALKDTWIDVDRPREGDILRTIRSSMNAKGKQKVFDAHFLTVLHDSDVYIRDSTQALHLDDSQLALYGNRVPEDAPRLDLSMTAPLNKKATPAVGRDIYGDTVDQDQVSLILGDQAHHRTVFREVCRPLYTSTSMNEAFSVLCQVCDVLRDLHRLGWVHRDVSTANILIDAKGVAKLADFEYAVQLEQTGRAHRIRTASEVFMAVEVQAHAYIFCAQKAAETSMETDGELELGSVERENSLRGHQQRPPPSPSRSLSPPSSQGSTMTASDAMRIVFRYNILHDLESLWWIALYFVFKREPVTWEEDRCVALRSAGKTVFADKRATLLGQQTELWELCTQALGSLTLPWGKKLSTWRQNLVALYKTIEDDPSSIDVPLVDYRRMQQHLSKILHRAAGAFHVAKLMIKPWDAGKSGAPPPAAGQATMGGAEINGESKNADPSSTGKETEDPTTPPIGDSEAGQSKSVGKRSRAQQDMGPPQKRQRANTQPTTCDRELRPRNRRGQVDNRVKQSRR